MRFLDLETTGRETRTDFIVELAVLKFATADNPTRFRPFQADGQLVRCCHRLDPTITIPAGVPYVHGITDADVLDGMLARYPDLPRTVAGLHGLTAGVDIEGKFSRDGDRVVLAFGKDRGRPLEELARDDPGYLRWMLGLVLLADARGLVLSALASRRGS